jgi:hypothetical protein
MLNEFVTVAQQGQFQISNFKLFQIANFEFEISDTRVLNEVTWH